MLRDGTVYSATKPRWCELPPPDAHWTKHNIHVMREWLALLSMHVSTGIDKLTPEVHRERAIKVTNEVRTRLLAMDKWPADGNPETIPFDAVAKARGERISMPPPELILTWALIVLLWSFSALIIAATIAVVYSVYSVFRE